MVLQYQSVDTQRASQDQCSAIVQCWPTRLHHSQQAGKHALHHLAWDLTLGAACGSVQQRSINTADHRHQR